MTSYSVKLFTFDGRTPSLQLSADDVLHAAAAAVPCFLRLGERVDIATALVVERGAGAFAIFRPQDVLMWMRERYGTDSEEVARAPSVADPSQGDSGSAHLR
jgi:hypothetical protein